MRLSQVLPALVDRLAESEQGLRGLEMGFAAALAMSRESEDTVDFQASLKKAQALVHKRAEALQGRGRQAGPAPTRVHPPRKAGRPSTRTASAEASEGFCLRVRVQMERNPGAVKPNGGDDARVIRFLTEEGSLLARDILGEYNPMEVPDLLKRFITMDFSDDDRILRFYEDFGPLGYPWSGRFPSYGVDWRKLRGEPVWWLERMAEELRSLMQVYHAWRSGKLSDLQRIFAFVPRDAEPADLGQVWLAGSQPLVYVGEALCYFGNGTDIPAAQRRRPTRQEALLLATGLIKIHVDLMLERVKLVLGTGQRESIYGRQPGPPPRKFVPCSRATCLLDALYLQLYEIFCGRGDVRICEACRRPFPLPGTQRGTKPLHCSDRCRWRANKRQRRSRPG